MSSQRSSAAERFERFFGLVGFELEPFQRQIAEEVFSPRRETLILEPRGNGKSTLLAALALFELLSTPNPQIAVGAASREQAGTLFEIARAMAAHPEIARRVELTRREIRTPTGWLRVVASDGPEQHGLILSLAIVDELHAHRDDELYLALRTGMLKRADAKLVTISTAGIGAESPLGRLHARARTLPEIQRSGAFTRAVGKNFAMLEWALPEQAEIDDMEAVKEANPASWLSAEALAEQREAVHELAFRRYHANQWVQAEAPWIAAQAWDACSAKPEIPDGASEVVLGVDAAIRHDSSAVATVWKDPAGIFHASFEVWTPTPERDVELELVVEHIRRQARRYRVRGVAFDPYFLWHAAQRLEAEGIAMVEWKQDNARMVPATQTLYETIVHQRLRHGGHEVARAHALAAEVRETERGLRIRKSGKERNDAVVALAMAVEWASRQAEPRESVYETRGLMTA